MDECTKKSLEKSSSLSAVTVSSSPNSIAFYQTDEEGMRFTPMKKTLAR
jgi:hypothetical protein